MIEMTTLTAYFIIISFYLCATFLNSTKLKCISNKFAIDKCKPLKAFCRNDALDEQVAALPPMFTSRFGEIIWAAGGVGFGWWPACIYDPRLTVGGARKLALKNIGKKHLVYFFGCSTAPFTVLADNKCLAWDEGMFEEYDNGKTAKAFGKTREWMFEWALQAAIAENDKPIECRLDWNHEEDSAVVAGKPVGVNKPSRNSTGGTVGGNGNGSKKIKSPLATTTEDGDNRGRVKKKAKKEKSVRKSTGGGDKDKEVDHASPSIEASNSISPSSSSNSQIAIAPTRRSSRERKPSRSFDLDPMEILSTIDTTTTSLTIKNTSNKKAKSNASPSSSTTIKFKIPKSPSQTKTDREFFCKICRNDDAVNYTKDDCDAFESSSNVGFVTMPSSQRSTFADARSFMTSDLDEDCLPSKWKFYVPHLGPLSKKQECCLGPMLSFLMNATNTVQFGDGSSRNPLKVVIYECK